MKLFFHSSRFSKLLSILALFAHTLDGDWRPSESSAFFTVKPNRVVGSSFFEETLGTYKLLAFGYSSIVNDFHANAFQQDMGFTPENLSEATLVFHRMMETLYLLETNRSVSQFQGGVPATVIFKIDKEVAPEVLLQRFQKWASGPRYSAQKIKQLKESPPPEFTAEQLAEMSSSPRIPKEVYSGMEKARELAGAKIFTIPHSMKDTQMKAWDLVVGVRADQGNTTIAAGLRDEVGSYFSHASSNSLQASPSSDPVATFEIPLSAALLEKMGTNNLSDPNGPLGPLAVGLGEPIQKIRKVSGTAQFSGPRVHLDMIVDFADSQSAQSLWSVAQASLGMSQLSAMRKQLQNPQLKPMISMDFMQRIKLQHKGTQVVVHVEALPVDLFPWAVPR